MGTTTHRFQMDLTREELDSIERLSALVGLKTKKDVILNAVTLLRWAAREVLLGRIVCSVNEHTGAVKQLEMPMLSALAGTADLTPLDPDEIRRRLAEPARPMSEVLQDLRDGGRDAEVDPAVDARRDKTVG